MPTRAGWGVLVGGIVFVVAGRLFGAIEFLVVGVAAIAAAENRAYATPDDVKRLARYVIPHRLLVTPEGRMRGTRPVDVVGEIIDGVPVPRPSNA